MRRSVSWRFRTCIPLDNSSHHVPRRPRSSTSLAFSNRHPCRSRPAISSPRLWAWGPAATAARAAPAARVPPPTRRMPTKTNEERARRGTTSDWGRLSPARTRTGEPPRSPRRRSCSPDETPRASPPPRHSVFPSRTARRWRRTRDSDSRRPRSQRRCTACVPRSRRQPIRSCPTSCSWSGETAKAAEREGCRMWRGGWSCSRPLRRRFDVCALPP
mmetsp:Transcript_13181/g.25176  ORF Transcript_13181/g.25176 Transcript_13181/m.25176 type:complete len:216 (-) Transcript_13181:2505-3152(-)